MISRLLSLLRRVSFRQLSRNPRAELGRIMAGFGSRLENTGNRISHVRRQLPAWLHDEINALAHIEPELLGSTGDGVHYRHYALPVVTRAGELYRQLVDSVGTGRVSHVLMLPWLVRGGADRGALYHLQAWAEAMPAANILVIVTEDVDSPWLDRIPAGIRMLPFGRIVGSTAMPGRVQLLTRLLVQMQPGVIHAINSRVAWESFRLHGLAMRQVSRLFASLFCDDQNDDGAPVGYARSYLRSCYHHLSGVFCDNGVFPDLWARELGVPRRLFTVLRFPYDRTIVHKEDDFAIAGTARILWAGRFDRQKRPDVLLAIAQALPTIPFDVHGVSELGDVHPAIRELQTLQNVKLHGAFTRFEDIVEPSHAAYLFTTSWEGLPTILLDAAALGLPIVAPAVGGIVDLIDCPSLVQGSDNVAAYVEQLKQLIDSPLLRRRRREQQYAALAVGRHWSDFTRTLYEVPCYFSGPSIAVAHREQGSTS
ncbi:MULTISPECIES: glycosyltransferase [unclassified Stenotrophomonas]|uniref:glycosyltransferase n=1 Tax=unclassified Stenotrophomonas TaxID=196198 RepID=UPI000FA1E597